MDPQYPGSYGQGPQQNYGYPSGQGNGQYDFIMGQGPQPKRSLLPGGNTSGGKLIRIVLFFAGLFILFIVGLIVYGMLTAGDKNYPLKLTGLLQTQQELYRISEQGAEKGRNIATRNIALNTNLAVLTDQTELSEHVKKNYKLKINGKVLDAKASEDTDKILADAEASNRYDEKFLEVLDTLIAEYKTELQALYNQAKSTKEKDIFQRSYDHMELLSQSAEQQ